MKLHAKCPHCRKRFDWEEGGSGELPPGFNSVIEDAKSITYPETIEIDCPHCGSDFRHIIYNAK